MRANDLFKKFTKKYKKLDFLAKEPSLQVGGESSFKTMVGSTLTIILGCLLLTSCSFIAYDFFRTDQPQIAQEKQYSGIYPKIDMFSELNVPILNVFINDTVTVPAADIPKYFTAQIISYKYEISGENLDTISTVKTWNYVPCSQVIANGIPKEKLVPDGSGNLQESLNTVAICADIKPGDTPSVQGQATDKTYELLSFEIYPCTLGAECVSADEVDQIGFTFSRGMKSMNLSNFENPITYKMSGDDFIYLNTASLQIYREFMLENKIIDDKGFMIGETERQTFYTSDRFFSNQKKRDSQMTQCDVE